MRPCDASTGGFGRGGAALRRLPSPGPALRPRTRTPGRGRPSPRRRRRSWGQRPRSCRSPSALLALREARPVRRSLLPVSGCGGGGRGLPWAHQFGAGSSVLPSVLHLGDWKAAVATRACSNCETSPEARARAWPGAPWAARTGHTRARPLPQSTVVAQRLPRVQGPRGQDVTPSNEAGGWSPSSAEGLRLTAGSLDPQALPPGASRPQTSVQGLPPSKPGRRPQPRSTPSLT